MNWPKFTLNVIYIPLNAILLTMKLNCGMKQISALVLMVVTLYILVERHKRYGGANKTLRYLMMPLSIHGWTKTFWAKFVFDDEGKIHITYRDVGLVTIKDYAVS